jgi:hypothetical protein
LTLQSYRNNWLRENAPMRAQAAYFRQRPQRGRVWRWLGAAAWWLGLVVSFVFLAALLLTSAAGFDGSGLYLQLDIVSVGFWIVTFLAHYALQFRTLALATGSLARERDGNTWELLVMTGISSKAIIRGKWWAVVRQQLPSYLWLGVLRAVAILWYGFAISSVSSSYSYSYNNSFVPVYPPPLQIIVAAVILFALTLLNLGFTAASGMVGAALGERGGTALARGVAVRLLLGLLPLVIMGICLLSIAWLFRNSRLPDGIVSDVGSATLGIAVTLLDNGITLGSPMSNVRLSDLESGIVYGGIGLDQWAAFIFAIPAYWLYTTLALRWAERRLRKLGALGE